VVLREAIAKGWQRMNARSFDREEILTQKGEWVPLASPATSRGAAWWSRGEVSVLVGSGTRWQGRSRVVGGSREGCRWW